MGVCLVDVSLDCSRARSIKATQIVAMEPLLLRAQVVCLAQEAFDPPNASTLDMHDKYIVDRKRSEVLRGGIQAQRKIGGREMIESRMWCSDSGNDVDVLLACCDIDTRSTAVHACRPGPLSVVGRARARTRWGWAGDSVALHAQVP